MLKCKWKVNDRLRGYAEIKTECNSFDCNFDLYYIEEYKFCPYCGKLIEEVKSEK